MFILFFFNDTATTEIYTLSLHDALPISPPRWIQAESASHGVDRASVLCDEPKTDRKSTRLNSSHGYISYAVFCLKKKKKQKRRYSHDRDQPRYRHRDCHEYRHTYNTTKR